jgi:hypothetical protein
MKTSSEAGLGVSEGGFRALVVELLPSIGLTVASVESVSAHHLRIVATSEDKVLPNSILVEAVSYKRKVGLHQVAELKARMDEKKSSEGVFISSSGFTQDGIDFAMRNRIMPFSPEDIQRGARKPPQAPIDNQARNIFERAFKSAKTLDDAAAYFNKQRKRAFFGLLGSEERVESIEGRYAPIGVFRMRKTPQSHTFSSSTRVVSGENRFFVNLSNCTLYFLYRGLGSSGPSLRSTNILRRLIELDETTVRILSDIFEQQEIVLNKIDPQKREYLEANINRILNLERLAIISPSRDGMGLLFNVNLPAFSDPKYDLGKSIDVVDSVDSSFPADAITYHSSAVLALMKAFLGSEGHFEGVIYMPYFLCRFGDRDGRVRWESLENAMFKNA